MQVIKFSHKYYKMPKVVKIVPTTLMQVLVCDKQHLSTNFLEYDTAYPTEKGMENYELPEGGLLVLILNTGGFVWTTLRRHTQEKERYYRTLQGQEVKIEIG
jgi:hypothetical protein